MDDRTGQAPNYRQRDRTMDQGLFPGRSAIQRDPQYRGKSRVDVPRREETRNIASGPQLGGA